MAPSLGKNAVAALCCKAETALTSLCPVPTLAAAVARAGYEAGDVAAHEAFRHVLLCRQVEVELLVDSVVRRTEASLSDDLARVDVRQVVTAEVRHGKLAEDVVED